MKFKIALIIVIICGFLNNAKSQITLAEEAGNYAKTWMNSLCGECKNIEKIKEKKFKNKISYYEINFEKGGYVLVSSEKGINPIIAYSKSKSFDEENLPEGAKLWLEWVNMHIENIRQKKEKLKSISVQQLKADANLDWHPENIATSVNVPSLFETHQTSRWAGWYPYSIEMPNQDGTNTCVPLAMAQIMKYYSFPAQGEGSYGGIDFSKQWYDYRMMPFRLTYCGNGQPNCNEGSFNIIPGIIEENSREVSKLIYHIGVSVGMNWGGSGTYGDPGDWVSEMENHFNYSSGWVYKDQNYIANNNSAFKTSLRNELVNGRPILFAYYGSGWSHGHAVVIDGVENGNYFHFAMGTGGFADDYYYLFDLDNDFVHNKSPYSTYYRAAYGIEPNCPTTSTLNLNNITISSPTNNVYQADNTVTMSNFVVDGNGTNGGRIVVQAGNEVNLNNGFEVKVGGEAFITTNECGPR